MPTETIFSGIATAGFIAVIILTLAASAYNDAGAFIFIKNNNTPQCETGMVFMGADFQI